MKLFNPYLKYACLLLIFGALYTKPKAEAKVPIKATATLIKKIYISNQNLKFNPTRLNKFSWNLKNEMTSNFNQAQKSGMQLYLKIIREAWREINSPLAELR